MSVIPTVTGVIHKFQMYPTFGSDTCTSLRKPTVVLRFHKHTIYTQKSYILFPEPRNRILAKTDTHGGGAFDTTDVCPLPTAKCLKARLVIDVTATSSTGGASRPVLVDILVAFYALRVHQAPPGLCKKKPFLFLEFLFLFFEFWVSVPRQHALTI
jgi:hypothetical protein